MPAIQLGGTPELLFCSRSSLRTDDRKEVAAHLQDFGARDATAGEVESNFTDRVLGNADTSHIIRQGRLFVIFDCCHITVQSGYKNALLCRGPKGLERLVGLAVRRCIPCAEGSMQPMAESDAYKLRNQVSVSAMIGMHHLPIVAL